MWHELQQMNAADGILTILKQTQREEIRRWLPLAAVGTLRLCL